jgi:uncharacterized protein YwqG
MLQTLMNLFAKKPVPPPAPKRDIAPLLAPLAADALHVVHTEAPSLSHFGGEPALPPGMDWPRQNGKRLDFLARLSLSAAHAAMPIDWLPRDGALLFFYDMENQSWGYDQSTRGAFAVIHVPELPAPLAQHDDAAGLLPRKNVSFKPVRTYPSSERESMQALDLNDDEWEDASELGEREFDGQATHQIAGFPNLIQGDEMEWDCEMIKHGLSCGSPDAYRDPRALSLKPNAANWRLLFQVDSDEALDMMWGDVGLLYFWVEADQARQGNFADAWVVLQCH